MNKFALVIGNGNYPESPLKNPTNDAEAVKEKLSKLGFKGKICKDAKIEDMRIALNSFGDKLKENEVGLFFFAGHGMQIDGANYLTAINSIFDREENAQYSSLPLDLVIKVMDQSGVRTSIIILDACRNNPYERKWRSVGTRGLAPVYAPKGMIIAYATSPGQVALDGAGENGAYTHALLQHISTQDIAIEELFKRVRNTLSSATKGSQISWEHTSLMGDFHFNYSQASDEFLAEYSEIALADSLFQRKSNAVGEIIDALKSGDWNKQNPAIAQITTQSVSGCDKDSLFVLGRNIYQTACGPAYSGGHFVESLQNHLSSIEASNAFHILNGILYEIYFDSSGKKRVYPKSEKKDDVFKLEDNTAFANSFTFIQQSLKPFAKELFYMPRSKGTVCVDIQIGEWNGKKNVITGVYFEGDNVLYDDAGKAFYDIDTSWAVPNQLTKSQFVQQLSDAMLVPHGKFKPTFTLALEPEDEVFAPNPLRVLRISR